MKKLFILLLVFIAVNSNAQRYTRQFAVTDINELNKGQSTSALIIQTDKWMTNGIFFTAIGISMLTFVGVINSRADNTPSDSWQRKFAEEYSAFLYGQV